MNLVSKLALGASALLLSANVMAASFKTTDCPSVATIQAHAKFSFATQCSDGSKDYWCMATPNFSDKGSNWNLAMIANIDATDASEAVRLGQDYFQTKVTLNEPQLYGDDQQAVCLYAMEEYQHAVAAFNPPVAMPGSGLKFKMFR